MRVIRPITVTDSVLTSSNVAETDYSAWVSGTTYTKGARVIIVAANVHQVYESLQNANSANDPTLTASATWWVLVGATNKWKMFDNSNTSQTTNTSSIAATLVTTTRADSIAFMNISTSTVRVKMTTVDGIVYDTTTNMNISLGVVDWYTYLFEPITRRSDFVVEGLPAYNSATFNITLTDTGNTVAIGTCVIGFMKNFGDSQYGAKVGIQDYSIKTKDAYGNYSITQRAFNKRADLTIYLPSGNVDSMQNILSTYRSIPMVYIASTDYTSLILYGFYKDFSIDISYPTYSVATVQLEALT